MGGVVGWVPQLRGTIVWALRMPRVNVGTGLCSSAGQGYRMCSMATQVLRSEGLKATLSSRAGLQICFLSQGVGEKGLNDQIRPPLAVQTDRATVWGLCLGAAASRNMVQQDLSIGCCEPTPSLHSYLIPSGQILQIPSVIPGDKTKWAIQEASCDAGGAGCLPAPFFHWKYHRPREVFSLWGSLGLGEG